MTRRPAGVPARIAVTDLFGAVTSWIAGKSPLASPMTRRPAGVPARIVVTDLFGAVTSWIAGKSLLGATATLNLDLPSQLTFDVRSGDRSVNTIYADGDPLVAQSNRLAYLFLRENPASGGPWVCRASGMIMSPQDEADTDTSTTHLTAFDPWQYFMALPCFEDVNATPIRQDGFLFPATPGNEIAYTLIQNTMSSLVSLGWGLLGIFADIPSAFGGTTHWDGTNQTTPTLDFRVQQGTSLGQALQNLASAGNDVQGTGQAIDIIFEPIYDPGTDLSPTRPGYLSQISIYDVAGVQQPSAPMAWARFTRTATTADREHDGTPGAMINVAQFGAGQGVPLELVIPVANGESIAKYGPYWLQQFFPGQFDAGVVNNLAVQVLTLQKQGKRTFAVDPDPLRAGMPFRDYQIGDRIPVLSTDGQRVPASGYQRVQTIPLVVGPDGVTYVSKLLTSPDFPGATAVVNGLAPTSGAAGDAGVTINALNFLPNTALSVTVGGVAATVTFGGTTDSNGDTTLTFTLPGSLADNTTYPVYVTDGANVAQSPSSFTIGTPVVAGRSFQGGWWTRPYIGAAAANSALWLSQLDDYGIVDLFVNTDAFTPAYAAVNIGTGGWVAGKVRSANGAFLLEGVPLNSSMVTPNAANPADTDNEFIITDLGTEISYEVGFLPGLVSGPQWNAGAAAGGTRPFPLAQDGWVRQQGDVNGISCMAAGSSHLGGLIFEDELAAGLIPHALVCSINGVLIRGPSNDSFTGNLTDPGAYVNPATRSDGAGGGTTIPMGTRVRLKATANIAVLSGGDPTWAAILTALRDYGAVIADSSGSNTAIVFYAANVCSPGSPTYPSALNSGLGGIISSLEFVTPATAPIYS